MKLTLRPEWRLRPLSSFLGFLDIKTGVIIAILFALLNKVAGVYGLVAVLTGAGGSAAQLTMYIYSVVALIALAWGLKAVGQEDAKHTLYFAHAFFADHILSTAWTIFFAVMWWVYTPHDGKQEIASEAQREIMEWGGGGQNMTDEERREAAMSIWKEEKSMATTFIVLGWIAKIYFALLLYSYAIHLRKGSYRTLPNSRSSNTNSPYIPVPTLPDEEEEVGDLYMLPVRNSVPGHSHTPSGSVSSFADFVTAPGRSRRGQKPLRKSALNLSSSKGAAEPAEEVDEVLFDEDEMAGGAHTTDESLSASGSGGRGSSDEDRVSLAGSGSSKARRGSHART
ncbi:hypothetical protein NM688_g8806 [Phlebia brevispora]|uniref:Uncharacterized protein n=1 Tax=Phlebia brevispora TaxID=194682 RepID=A0ACC1RPR8_9APHY|nr:hypothetical protein NM688_g8806 [Phlebia brevispora]